MTFAILLLFLLLPCYASESAEINRIFWEILCRKPGKFDYKMYKEQFLKMQPTAKPERYILALIEHVRTNRGFPYGFDCSSGIIRDRHRRKNSYFVVLVKDNQNALFTLSSNQKTLTIKISTDYTNPNVLSFEISFNL